ncbi:putative Transmembrane protein [Melia azedarach]|uniref:Transmembrane protein n=1 Tax=Melia azedarach TaxID=155640 RepID=A0ACC1XQC6_MELAZ|nr:putative Transmembrane protein [Melia azedarach]
MGKTSNILRRSIYTFLQNYQYLTTTAALLAFPFSAAILFSQAFVPSSLLLQSIYNRLNTIFQAAGLPNHLISSEFFTWKLSQTISSSISTLPFTLTFLLFSKASIIQTLNSSSSSSCNILSIFKPLLTTYVCNSFFILSANATVFCLFIFGFNFLEGISAASGLSNSPNCLLLLSAVAAVVYSLVLANALIVCNLALVLSGIERSGGYLSILKAFVLIRSGRITSVALSLALPINLVLAAIEALFQYRILRMPAASANSWSLASEGIFIAYLYSISVVLDTVVTFVFYKSCKNIGSSIEEQQLELEDTSYSYQIEEGNYYVSVKKSQQFP